MALKLIQLCFFDCLVWCCFVFLVLFGFGFFNALVLDKTKLYVTSKSCLKTFWALSTGKVLSL